MLYDYRCAEHGKFEAKKPMADRHTAKCPTCGVVCEKVMSVPGDIIIPARFLYDKAGIREVTGGYSMPDIRHNVELRKRFLG